MMEKIRSLVSMYYPLQNNKTLFLKPLSNKHMFLASDFDKIQSFIKIILLDKLIYY